MENAYIKINGKEIKVPKCLTFEQIVLCEEQGLTIEGLEKKPFKSMSIILSAIEKVSLQEAIEDLNKYFEEDGNFEEIATTLFNSFASFFHKTTKTK